jgi:hypothetical protein
MPSHQVGTIADAAEHRCGDDQARPGRPRARPARGDAGATQRGHRGDERRDVKATRRRSPSFRQSAQAVVVEDLRVHRIVRDMRSWGAQPHRRRGKQVGGAQSRQGQPGPDDLRLERQADPDPTTSMNEHNPVRVATARSVR